MLSVACDMDQRAPTEQARRWRAYVLAENDRIDELRQHAETVDDHAQRQLASWLSDRRQIDEAITVIRPLAAPRGGSRRRPRPANPGPLAGQGAGADPGG